MWHQAHPEPTFCIDDRIPLPGTALAKEYQVADRRFRLGGLSERKQFKQGCSAYSGEVLLPDCTVWRSGWKMPLMKLEPFFDDGTCDGSKGGQHIPDQPDPFNNPIVNS
jgi:hypothetical protein